MLKNFDLSAAWKTHDLKADRKWVFSLNDLHRTIIRDAVQKVYDPDRPIFDYRREEFDFGSGLIIITAAIREAYHGRGIALLHGLPREELSEQEFSIMN